MILVLLAVSAFGGRAAAQSTTTGAIEVNVTDPQGLAVPGAALSCLNTGTAQELKGTVNEQGQYHFVDLQPGAYKITASAAGFNPGVQDGVVVEVGRVTYLSVPLQVGGGKQTVEVKSAAPLVTTSQPDFSNNVNQKFISEIPMNGRRWSFVALSTPGAVPDGNFGLVSFRGISGLLNNNTVDGGDNNQAFFSEERGRTRISYVISMASIQEFQVNTSNYSAEYGRAAGGVVNAVTKSGTNNIHGDGFYYDRDNAWGATNPFTTEPNPVPGGTPASIRIKPVDRRQQFGGDIGGPIKKDKLFFFFSYDEQLRNFPGVGTPSSASFFNPVTVALPVTCTPPKGVTLTTGQTLACRGLTQAQSDAGMSYLQALAGTVPRTGDQYLFFPKVDWQINDHHRLTGEYNHLTWNSPAGIQTAAAPNFGKYSFGNDYVRDDSLILRLTSALGATTTNELRFQWGRDFEYEFTQTPGANEFKTGPNGTAPEIFISATGSFEVGKPNFLDRRAYPDEKRTQIADTFSKSMGNHFFKAGADFNHVYDLLDSLFTESGAYTEGSLAAFLTDFNVPKGCTFTPTPPAAPFQVPCYSNYVQGFGPTAFHFTTDDIGLFAQDDWHATRRLTVNLGLRWEYESLPKSQVANPNFPATGTFPKDKNNFGPRIGFAWDVFGNGKTSLRGGYGIYYGRVINSTISNAITNTGSPAAQISAFFLPTTTGAPAFPNTLASASASGTSSIVYFDPNFQLPLIHQTDLVLEREIGWNTVLSASFLGSYGTDLPNFIDTNLSPPTSTITYTVVGGNLNGQQFNMPLFTGKRPNPNFAQITDIISNVQTHYAALVLQANRRLAKGLEFRNNYTWSHSTDNGQNSQTFTANNAVFDPYNLSLERGNSNVDIRNRFASSVVWSPDVFKGRGGAARKIFNGYTLSPLIFISDGAPYTPGVSGNAPVSTPGGGIIGSGGSARFPFYDRNSFTIRSVKDVDFRISRRFTISDKYSLDALAEAFNIFNHENFTNINSSLYFVGGTAANPTLTYNTSFGIPSGENNTLLREREIQIAVRFQF